MKSIFVGRGIPFAAFFVIVAATAMVSFQAGAQGRAQRPAPDGATRTVVLNNSRLQLTHITFPPNSDMEMHSIGTPGDNRYDLMILLTPAKLEGQVDDKIVTSDKPGSFWEIPGAPSQHAFRNRSNQPIEAVVVQLK